MAQRIAGIAFLKVDGNQYPLRGNFTVTPSVIGAPVWPGKITSMAIAKCRVCPPLKVMCQPCLAWPSRILRPWSMSQ